MSSSSPSSRRHGGMVPLPPPPAPGSLQDVETRDWASLPRDIVLDIFLRLGPREVMMGAEFACKPWRSVALEEPSLWRHIGMENIYDKHRRWRHISVVNAMKLVAVDRAAGHCEAFHGHCDDEYLLSLVERAPSLKSLHIDDHYSDYESGEGLVQALMKLPHLEELQVYFSYIIEDRGENMLPSICQACPHLSKLVLMYAGPFDLECNEDEYSKERIDGKLPLMPKLHTLELCECELTVEGLKAILDSCPVLETLCIDGYFNKREMDKKLRMKCARVKNLTLPTREGNYNYYATEEFCYYDTDSHDDYSVDEDSVEEETCRYVNGLSNPL